jgi:excisionase family DNA binding protein
MSNSQRRPTLEGIIRNPTLAASLTVEEIGGFLAQLAAVQTALAAKMIDVVSGTVTLRPERLLKPLEAAERLGVSRNWIYVHAPKLPFTVRFGGRVRFSEKGLERYLANRRGAH